MVVPCRSPLSAPSAAPRPIALARSYSDLQRAIADYCELTGMTALELDAEAGIANGNSSKTLAAALAND